MVVYVLAKGQLVRVWMDIWLRVDNLSLILSLSVLVNLNNGSSLTHIFCSGYVHFLNDVLYFYLFQWMVTLILSVSVIGLKPAECLGSIWKLFIFSVFGLKLGRPWKLNYMRGGFSEARSGAKKYVSTRELKLAWCSWGCAYRL